jgi:glycosyltransferase involved in cell wall biosynthesis
MKVLWFEVSIPRCYKNKELPLGGWQDSLETLLRTVDNVELVIAFQGRDEDQEKTVDGVKYIPLVVHYSYKEKWQDKWSSNITCNKIVALAKYVVEKEKPDIIHVFGSEWYWGQVQAFTNIPVVIHIQGSIPPYYNCRFPPMYSSWDIIRDNGWNIKKQIKSYWKRRKDYSWMLQEEKTLRTVKHYMGRTKWDHNLVKLYNAEADYYYCSEALRSVFFKGNYIWAPHQHKIFRIITTGATTFWKGVDTILRTAHKLKECNFDFEWIICGNMLVKDVVEKKEKLRFYENNVKILGFIGPEELKDKLLSSDLYVHTAYIDNSPNAICEAQYLGMPIIATYVGGIPSLIKNGKEGVLIPANDPFTLAQTIIDLSVDKTKCESYGYASMIRAKERHNSQAILKDLLYCYNSILLSKK